MLSFLESFLEEKMQTLNKQLSANSELLAQLSKQVDELQAAKKPLKIDVLDTSHESSDAKRPSTTDNRKRQDFLKAEETKHKKEEEDQKKEEAKHKKEEDERKKEEAKKKMAEEKAAKEAAKKQKEEELAKKKEADRLAKQQKEEEAKREKARKEEEMKAKKEEEKAAKKQKEEELAKKKEAERLAKQHKEESKKEEEGKKKAGEKRADPKGKAKAGKKEGAKEPAPHVEETKAPSEEPKTEEPPAEPLALPEGDSVDKGVKFSEDDNLLEEKPEETSEPPKEDPVAPIQAEIEKMEKSLGADVLQQSKPFALSIGSKSALILLSNLEDAVFHLTSIPEPEVIWAFRIFFQLRNEPLPPVDEEAWTHCQAFLGKLLESKETLPSELQKVFAEQLIFSNENIDQVEQLVKGNEAKLDPAIYSDSSALVGILMFPLKDACTYCGLLPEKVDSWRRYQRLLHKKKLLQGS